MKHLPRCLAALLVAGALIAEAEAQVHVRGYFRKDGTYVAPHVRSSPNGSRFDNYSTRGNFNPYTGRQGTVDPYRLPALARPSYSPPTLPAKYRQPAYAPAPAVAQQVASYWRCADASGARTYLAYPRAGCEEVQVAVVPAAPPPRPALQFLGYPCTVNCSGHEAGYAWAEEKGIDDPDDCGGNSYSFIEGCEAYAQEQQVQMVEDGECEDEDEDGLCDY